MFTGSGSKNDVDKIFKQHSTYLLATLQFWSPWRQTTKLELWTPWFLFYFHMKYLKRFLLPESIRWGICGHTWWAMVCQQDHTTIICLHICLHPFHPTRLSALRPLAVQPLDDWWPVWTWNRGFLGPLLPAGGMEEPPCKVLALCQKG